MNVAALRSFLVQSPKPATLRVHVDDAEQEVKLNRSFIRTAETVLALAPDLVECLDKDGKVLRAIRIEVDGATPDIAAVPAALTADPTALMVTHIADLLHRAYKHSTEVAFNKMVEVFDIVNARAENIEQRLERSEAQNRRLVSEQIETELERAEQQVAGGGANGFEQAIAEAFMSGRVAAAQQAPQPNGKPPAPKPRKAN